jgi:hypothetical protein
MHSSRTSEFGKICFKLRQAIKKEKQLTMLLNDFPFGCCRDSAVILGLYLIKIGYQNVNYCRRPYDDVFKSHGWIEVENLILDLTADQFGPDFLPITIIPNSTNRPIYQSKVCEPCTIGIVSTDFGKLIHDYDVVTANMNK